MAELCALQVRQLQATWVSNEGLGVLPWVAKRLMEPIPPGAFLLSVDEEPVALCGPHGQYVEWLKC
jgi:hypothetical protein